MSQPAVGQLVRPDHEDHSDGLGDFEHYYQFDHFDQFDHPSVASQQPDTLGASAYGPDPSRSADDTAFDQQQHHQQAPPTQPPPSQHLQQQQPQPPVPAAVSPAPPSQLPPAAGHEVAAFGVAPHQPESGPSLEASAFPSPSQPYRPESVPVHARSPPLHSPRSTRSHSLAASLASLGSQSPIRRKPLSPTASPLAVRFSSKLSSPASYMPQLPASDLDNPPDSGFFSLNSPDLYELGPKGDQNTGHGTSLLSTPLEEHSDEE